MELTVLGCSGSFSSPRPGACSGYLVRDGDTAVWMDCGNGTFEQLQKHVSVDDLTAVIITHTHPDHSVDLYGLHIAARYADGRAEIPLYGPSGFDRDLAALVHDDWGRCFDWRVVHDGDRAEIGSLSARFSRTDHPPPTVAVELSGGGHRLVYTADTGPGWDMSAFDPGADLVLSEATYLHDNIPVPIHYSAHQAGTFARAARAKRLMITHIWPRVSIEKAVLEASEAYGDEVTAAAMHLVTEV